MWLVVIKFIVLTFSQKAKKKELKILTEAITERDAKYTPPYL